MAKRKTVPKSAKRSRGPPTTRTFAERLIEAHLKQLERHVHRNGVKGLEALYKEAKADLYDRLHAVGPLSEAATATQIRAMLAQVEGVLEVMGGRIFRHLQDTAGTAATIGARHGVDEYKRLAEHFTGTAPVLSLDRAAIFRNLVGDATSSLLFRHQLQTRTWTASAISSMERSLSVGAMAGKSLEAQIKDVMGAGGILEEERWKAERIVRTENSYAHGNTKYRAMKRTEEDVGPMHKKLIETFDDRTGDDSFLVHGQTVPLNQPFSYKHKRLGKWVVTQYQHPPNRPNDRAVVIPWDPSWEESAEEKALSKAELNAARPTRWRKSPGVEIPPGHRPGKPYK